MLKNYIIATLRSLLKRKIFMLVNVLGFSLGICSSMLMFAYVWDEIGYDHYHPDKESLFRVALTRHFPDRQNSYATTPPPLGPTLLNEFPEVKSFVRILDFNGETRIRLEDRTFYENRVSATDSTFFDLFGVKMLEGNPNEVLKAPNSIVITQSMNEKYFGGESGLNKALEVGDTTKFIITGICEDVPKKSHFKFDMLVSLHSFPVSGSNFWGSYSLHNYIKLGGREDKKVVEAKLKSILEPHFGPQVESILGKTYKEYVDAGNVHDYFLQPIQSIHLNSRLDNELEPNGDIRYVTLFLAIAVLILAIASFNFTNLSTANSVNRSKEIGVRKVMGSTRKQLIFQFLAESLIITFLAVLLSLAIATLLLPTFNQLAGKNLEFSDFNGIALAGFFLLLTIAVGLLSGLYPAFFMSSFEITKIFKNGVKLSNSRFGLRNILVTFQFAASIFMVIATVFIVLQLDFMREQKLGFEKERMLLLEVSDNLGSRFLTFKDAISNQPAIASVTSSFHVPGRRSGGGTFQAIGIPATERFLFNLFVTEYDFHEAYEMELASGRYLDNELNADTASVIINEACSRMVGWNVDEAVGQQILITGQESPRRVVGVLKDFHFTSLHEPIKPMVFIGIPERNLGNSQPQIMSVKLRENTNVEDAVNAIERKWAEYVPGEVMRYSFIDEDFDNLYENEISFSALFKSFSVLAIVISSIGVIGLSFFIAVERVKEIGIRKVLGATVTQIMALLSKDFLILAAIANGVTWPLTYLLVHKWMSNYAYSPGINFFYFVIIGVAFVLLILAVISSITYRAANDNPVDAIGTE